jgi:hypothetical protein
MTVDEFAIVLRDPKTTVAEEGFYLMTSTWIQAIHECRNRWYWYSVSATLEPVSPTEVAAAITSPDRRVNRSGPYKSGRGFEATVTLRGHSYMLGHGNNRPIYSN